MRNTPVSNTLAIKPFIFASVFAILGAASVSAPASVISNFNVDAEGWTLANNDPNSTLAWNNSGGNPGGYIQFTDGAQGAYDDFSAPAKFLGNDSAYINGTLSFDLNRNQPGDNAGSNPLTITGSGGSISLVITAPPTGVWTSYKFAMGTSAGWLFNGGQAATQNQISTVLANVSSISVPADIYNGSNPEQAGLDNFALVPEPASMGLLTIGAAGLLMRRRSVRR